jgi:hypothetical protein
MQDLIVGGFDGFIHEDTKHKRTYISSLYEDDKKKKELMIR